VEIVNWMSRDPVCVTAGDTLAKARSLMDAGHFRRLPVVEDGVLVAILTERDLRSYWSYLHSTRVDEAMTPEPVKITAHDTAETAARLMLKHKIGGLPVVEKNKLIGIVTTSDLLRALLNVVHATQLVMEG
jgi:acetoin utilization protein AcuB